MAYQVILGAGPLSRQWSVCTILVTALSFLGTVGAGEFVSPCESADNTGEPSVLEEPRGPLPLNKTLFLGYAFLLTMATTSDKLASRSKLLDGPTGSSEEEEGKFPGALIHALSFQFPCEEGSVFLLRQGSGPVLTMILVQ